MRRWLGSVVLVVAATGCGGGDVEPTSTPSSLPAEVTTPATRPDRAPTTVRVPDDHATIQGAIDAAVPGDVVLVAPGTYRETVVIETDGIQLRGTDRSAVIIDGEGKRENGVKVFADGVAVENLTVQNHAANGVLVTGDGYEDDSQVRGFRLRYLTSHANDLYGIYAFAAQDGLIEQNYASGSGDAGIYVGRCEPCNTVVTANRMEHNGVGFVGTNASTGLVVASNAFRANRVGIAINSQNLEKKAPQHDAVVVGNLVDGADAALSPAQGRGGFGLGIAIGGGRRDDIVRNRVVNQVGAGMVVTDLDGYAPQDVRITENELSANTVDIAAYRTQVESLPGDAMCLAGNTLVATSPADLAVTHPCGPTVGSAIAALPPRFPSAPPGVAPAGLPTPPPGLVSMPSESLESSDPVEAPVLPEVATIALPA